MDEMTREEEIERASVYHLYQKVYVAGKSKEIQEKLFSLGLIICMFMIK